MKKILVAVFVLHATFAAMPGEMLKNPALEARAQALTKELRCMVCQNQSIDESEAPLARDLRRLVRDQVAAGKSDAEIRDFLVARYGEFVLLRPPLRSGTYLLWFMPLLAVFAGIAALTGLLKRKG